MPLLTDGWPSKRCLDAICTLVFHYAVAFLFLICRCRGQSQVVGPSQPIVVTLGEDIMLPCHLEPAMDVTDMTIEWTRPDLNPRFVHVLRDGVELESKKHPSYVNRTSVSINKLRSGDISLKLYKVQLSDEGKYRCFIPTLHRDSTVELVVGAVSSLTISLMRTDDDKDLRGVAVQCESAGWYPEPEVLWLDGEGKLFSAGPTETVRGPDDLYTVSSRVTVEKRHSNSFTCRVQQRNINHTTETHIQIPDGFFNAARSSSAPIAVSLAVVSMVILLVVFIVWKWRQKQNRKFVRTGNNFTTTLRNNTEIPLLVREKRKTLPIMLENMEMKDLDELKTNLDAELKAVEGERKDVVGAVNLLMGHKKDLENQEHDLRSELNELEKNRFENQCQLLSLQGTLKQIDENDVENSEGKQNEKEISDTKTTLDTAKKELENKIRTTDLFLKSTLCGINIVTERKIMLDDDKEQIYKQLEEIEKQRDEIQKKLRSEQSETQRQNRIIHLFVHRKQKQ